MDTKPNAESRLPRRVAVRADRPHALAARGRRLGAALKSANHADLPDDVRLVHTWTAPTDTAMHRTDTVLGFRVMEHMYEVQARIA